MNQRKTKKYMGYSGLLVILLIAIDQFTKWLAYTHLYQKPDVSVIDGVFQLKYLENDSAAFSLDPVSILHRIFHFTYFDSHPEAFLMAKMIFFAVLTIVVLVLLAIVYQRIPLNRRFLPLNVISVGIFAGAAGNLIDRVIHHYVIDFFYFSLINFPVFNVADIYVTLSAIALIIVVLFYYKEEDFSLIFTAKRKGVLKPCRKNHLKYSIHRKGSVWIKFFPKFIRISPVLFFKNLSKTNKFR